MDAHDPVERKWRGGGRRQRGGRAHGRGFYLGKRRVNVARELGQLRAQIGLERGQPRLGALVSAERQARRRDGRFAERRGLFAQQAERLFVHPTKGAPLVLDRALERADAVE